MTTIVAGGWETLGYRRVPEIGGRTRAELLQLIQNQSAGVYDVQGDGWIRKVGRGTDEAPVMPIEFHGVFSQAEQQQLVELAAVSGYSGTTWAQHHPDGFPNDLTFLVDDFVANQDEAKGFVNLGKAIAFTDPTALTAMLSNTVLPAFFDRFPDGLVGVMSVDPGTMGAAGLARGLYSLSHVDYTDLDSTAGFPALREWEHPSAESFANTLVELFGLLLYPAITAYRCGKLGLSFIFIPEPSREYLPDVFPADWLALLGARSTFGEQSLDPFGGDDPADVTHRRYRYPRAWSAQDIAEFLTWFVDRASTLLFELQDPCNFADGHGVLDPVLAFEHQLTVARLVKRVAAVASVREGANAKPLAFEVADLLDTLAHLFGGKGSTVLFKELFNPSTGRNLIYSGLSSIPGDIGGKLVSASSELYDDLRNVVLDSVWVPGKRQAGTVLVKNRKLTAEIAEDEDLFVANVVRALRNGHHGYFTAGDPQNRPSRYLFMVNGNTPDSLSALPALWLLAYLADPSFAGWQPLGIQTQAAIPAV